MIIPGRELTVHWSMTLLGTRIGKLVAYIVLGAFDRGTRRIRQVVVWHSPSYYAHMRVDLELIEMIVSELKANLFLG